MPRLLLRALVGASLLSQLLIVPALAHAALEFATPGPGDEVAGPPEELVLRFSQDLDPSRTSIEVRDAAGTRVARGGELGEGPREFRLRLPVLSPGGYEVRWTSFSAEDGELARDAYAFTVVAATSPTPLPTTRATAAPSPTVTSAPTLATTTPAPASPSADAIGGGTSESADAAGVLVPIVAALIVVGATALWLARRRVA